MNKKSKYYKEGYNNPVRCAEQIVNISSTHQDAKWVKEMSEGVKDAMTDRSKGNYRFK